jgi:hypothetical protein
MYYFLALFLISTLFVAGAIKFKTKIDELKKDLLIAREEAKSYV